MPYIKIESGKLTDAQKTLLIKRTSRRTHPCLTIRLLSIKRKPNKK